MSVQQLSGRCVLPRQKVSRKGHTIIEILMVLSLCGLLVGGAIGVAAIARGSGQEGRVNSLHRQEVRRFANDARSDIHTADGCSFSNDDILIGNESEGRQIVYKPGSESDITRVVKDQSGTTISNDRYVFANSTAIEAELIDQGVGVQWTIRGQAASAQPIVILATRRLDQ